MKTYKRVYASGGDTKKSKAYNANEYKPLGESGKDFFNQGWFMDSDPVKGVYSYKNSMPVLNDVALKDKTKGYLGVTMNDNGLMDLDIKDSTGKAIQNIFKGGSYKDLNTYMTSDKSLVAQRNNRVLKTTPAISTDDTNDITNTVTKLATGGVSGMDWSGIAGAAPEVLNSIMSLFGNNNNQYSTQPIVNPSSARTMVSPYGYGGMSNDLGISDEDLQQLQDEADQQGISVEELIQQMQNAGQDDTDGDSDTEGVGDNDTYAKGGFKLNPAHKGWCTPMSKSTCTGRRRQFAINAKNGFKKHAFGGASSSPINVEGKEIVEPPGGAPMRIHGPSHEQGGVDINVPDGTKIFSKRLKLDGKTMEQRKVARERRMNKLNKLLQDNPTNKLLKNTHSRTLDNITAEENQDMAIQTIANKIYSPPQEHGFGGDTGTDIPRTGAWWETYNEDYPTAPIDNTPINNSILNKGTGHAGNLNSETDMSSRVPLLGFGPTTSHRSAVNNGDQVGNFNLTTGDIIGMAGEAFNGIAPLINTKNAYRATTPAINRYQDFGKDALDANDSAQRLLATTRSNEQTDLDTDYNTMVARNNSNASSINTSRAMNTAADVIRARGRSNSNANYVRGEVGLLGQKGALSNARDQYRGYGQTQADLENEAIKDNYFTNHGQDLVNLGNSIEGIGSNFNTAHGNQVDEELLSQLSQYGLGFDKRGKLISVGS